MRAFIAISLPAEVKNQLTLIQNQLKNSRADVKWVEPDNLHLTLKFLGEINEKTLDNVEKILEETTENNSIFKVRLGSLGAFPSLNSPRVIWVDLKEGSSEVKIIAAELERKIAFLGIPKEDKPFSCHITLGRTRSALNRKELIQLFLNSGEKERLEFGVEKITLFKSTLKPSGPVYEALKEANLKNS